MTALALITPEHVALGAYVFALACSAMMGPGFIAMVAWKPRGALVGAVEVIFGALLTLGAIGLAAGLPQTVCVLL